MTIQALFVQGREGYYDETAPEGGIAKLFKEIDKYVVSRGGGPAK